MPTAEHIKGWRAHAENVAAGFDLETARKCFVGEYVDRRKREMEMWHYRRLVRSLGGRIGALTRRLAKFRRCVK